MEVTKSVGSIHLIMACMFSGKSTELIRLANRYRVLDKKVLVIKHSLDIRYSLNKVSTHEKQTIECVTASNLHEEINKSKKYIESDVIIIEEAQFFEDLYRFVIDACDNDFKDVIVVGLDGDSNKEEFGEILRLIPKSDTYKKLYGLCVKCKDGTPACFTQRLVSNKDQVLIGSHEFIAVCRKHHTI